MDFPVETFTAQERAQLAPHFSNLDRPVFALVGLPETVKGALFARYSRYQGTLRRLFLDEFADSLPAGSAAARRPTEGDRAAELYERIFLGYGDDSVAQLGGAHVACEWMLQRADEGAAAPAAGLLPRAVHALHRLRRPDARAAASRYYRDAELGRELRGRDGRALRRSTRRTLPRVAAWVDGLVPGRPVARPRAARSRPRRWTSCAALLPAASLSHMGIYASGQTYEQLILHLLAHPLPEARRYGQGLLEAVQAVMPSFVARVERPDRGGEWVEYLQRSATPRRAAGRRAWAWTATVVRGTTGPSVRLLHVDGDEEALLAALLFEAAGASAEDTGASAWRRCRTTSAPRCWATSSASAPTAATGPAAGSRRCATASRSSPTTARSATCSATGCSPSSGSSSAPHLGAGVPEEVDAAGCGDDVRRAYEVSRAAWQDLVDAGLPRDAPYALCLGYRIRFVLDLNAREAMQLIELRSGREGHPSYRAVAHEMHRQIAAVHPAVAAAMTHVDTTTEPRLERILAEMRTDARQGVSR